jgi:hypothetical protein
VTTVTDRVTVVLFSLASFLAVLAVLAHQLPATQHPDPRPSAVLRKIYRTTVVETIAGGGGAPSMTQSVTGSSSGSSATQSAPTTRVS